MKVAILGGGSVRTPLLIRGLCESRLPIDHVALHDIDRDRVDWMIRIARDAGIERTVSSCPDVDDAIRDARFVFASIRAGGIEARAADEAACRRDGLVAQETVGACGFALGYRNIPPMVDYARRVAELAPPETYLINFTNPVGMVTQAIATETEARVIGICDTPTELFAAVSGALGLDSLAVDYDYFGLNHLGWLREVRFEGRGQMFRLWEQPELLDAVYRSRLFSRDELDKLRLLPSEYLFYYYHPEAAIDNVRRAGTSRGEALAAANRRLFEDLRSTERPSEVYRAYLSQREDSYFRLESGGEPTSRLPGNRWTGYDRIAVAVAEALWLDDDVHLPVNVPNGKTLSMLAPEDVVEVVCRLGAEGAKPVPVEAPPAAVAPLISRVKHYERETIRAALSTRAEDILSALESNPLVADVDQARRLSRSLRLATGTSRSVDS